MAMGIYSFMLFMGEEAAPDLLPLLERYVECAFFFFIDVKSAHAGWLDAIDRYANVMPVLGGDAKACEAAADRLLEKKCLYSAYLVCSDENIDTIETGDWMEPLSGAGYIFTFLITLPGATGRTHDRVTSLVNRARGEQWSPLILIDFLPDIEAIDAAISNEPCFLGINDKGFVYVKNPMRLTDVSVRGTSMREIIHRLMPRTGTVQPAPV